MLYAVEMRESKVEGFSLVRILSNEENLDEPKIRLLRRGTACGTHPNVLTGQKTRGE